GALRAATLYSAIVFSAAVPLWMFNSLAAVIRGGGDMAFPAWVVAIGAVVLVVVSPLLIFGWGPFPALGVAGGGVAIVAYYVVGAAIFAWRIWSGRGVLQPPLRPMRPTWAPMREILRVGAASSIVSLSTNLTMIAATGLAGSLGQGALAGYGAGVRLEYLLVPLVFGLGAPMAAMVGTCIGAGLHARALQVAWIGAALAGGATEAIGLAAALHPEAWLRLFGDDPQMLETGAAYLRIVGPAYGFFGAGLALYFASQGAGRLRWPVLIALARVALSVGGGWLALTLFGTAAGLFAALALALAVFGLGNAGAILAGAWGRRA
ncbi:MAG TPA: MATE family efflux transporter, partial [Beijerinckiaceae bacterium]